MNTITTSTVRQHDNAGVSRKSSRTRLILGACAVFLTLVPACQLASGTVTSPWGAGMEGARQVAPNGPKARIAIAAFEDKTVGSGEYRAELGRGLSDMLATALFQTNRFIVLEREGLDALLAEGGLASAGLISAETATPTGGIEGADLLILASITGFEPNAGGVSGVGGILGSLGLGGLSGGMKKSRIAMDLKVVDTRTSRLVAATSAEGVASSFSGGLAGSTGSMAGGLGAYANSPMEDAIREMIRSGVTFLCKQTPEQFFRPDPIAGSGIAQVAPGASGAGFDVDGGASSVDRAPADSELADPVPAARHPILTVRSDVHEDVIIDLMGINRRGDRMVAELRVRLQGGVDSKYLGIDFAEFIDMQTGEAHKAERIDGCPNGYIKQREVVRVTLRLPEATQAGDLFVDGLGTLVGLTVPSAD